METLVFIIVGLAIGLCLGFFVGDLKAKGKANEAVDREREAIRKEMAEENERILKAYKENADTTLSQYISEKDKALAMQLEQHSDAMREHQEQHDRIMQQQELRHKEAIDAMSRHFEEIIRKMREEVVNTTNTLLKDRQKEFSAESARSLDQLISPLNENIRKMREAVKENTDRNIDFSGQLKEGITNVLKQSQAAKESADKLTSALSTGTKVQGNWGERILAEILESTGLKEGIHFETQEYIRDENGHQIKGEDGKGLQPDVILHMDGSHEVIVDSKVSLTAFFRYNDTDNEYERRKYLKEHIDSMRGHVRRLAGKDYSRYLKGSLDYVIMFVPVSQALYLATSEDRSLWREAMEQGVYIADEQTIYAALKIISLNWKQQAQAENHEQVYRLANEMLDRVGQFLERFSDMGDALKKAENAYNDSLKKLSDRGQSIPATCRKLTNLGASYNKGRRKSRLQTLIEPDDTTIHEIEE